MESPMGVASPKLREEDMEEEEEEEVKDGSS